ncbi:MAG: hypothetical protein ACI8UD_004105 [Planctomycetota bacterium]|jgi:hypothetical protein
MQFELGRPWFDSALERLEVRRGNRLLAIDPSVQEVAALRSVVGSSGELTLVMQDRQLAEQLAENQWPLVTVLAHETTGGEIFGTHDSMLIAPRTGPLLPVEAYAKLASKNLRPGGRFVVDLPADDMVPDIRAAWHELSWDEERLQPLQGVSDVDLTEAMRAEGLRSVESALGSHLLHAPAPAELAAGFAEVLGLNDDEITELGHAIVRLRQGDGPIDALVHRTQVSGQR